MDEENKPIGGEQAVEETTPVSEDLTSSAEESSEQATSEVAQAAGPDQPQAQTNKEDKPTRLQKRLHDLTGKLKANQAANQNPYGAYQPQPDAVSDILGNGGLPWSQGQTLEPGQELTPDEFQRIVDSRAATIAELKVGQALGQIESRNRLTKAIDDWTGDAERIESEVSGYGDAVAESFSKLVAKMNTDDKGQLMPRVKPSEVWAEFKAALVDAGEKRAGQVSASLAQQQAEGAAPPTTSASQGKDYEADELFSQASSTGRTEDWAAYLKKTMFKSS